MKTVWRWLDLPKACYPDELNMQIDEALMDGIILDGALQTIRLYSWSTSFVTYGRNQRLEKVAVQYPNERLLQRPTGGRAVIHGHDLTVSIAADEQKVNSLTGATDIHSSYKLLLSPVLDALRAAGCGAITGITRKSVESVDCFATVTKCDIVMDDLEQTKIVGCAQFRRCGAILQQMSIKPDARYHIHTKEFAEQLKMYFSQHLKICEWITDSHLSKAETARLLHKQPVESRKNTWEEKY